MNQKLISLYQKCRLHKPFTLVGSDAKCSLDAARTLLAWQQAESDGLVRMRCEPEQENYFDVYGKPEPWKHGQTQEQATRETEEMLERYGVWWTCSEWWDGNEWQMADSCGMHAGYKNPLDPFENCYVIDEMQSALDAMEAHYADERETAINEPACLI